MSLKSIIGQPLAVQLVERWLEKKTTQPLLFYGPDGVGQRTLAMETAKALNCKAGNCGQCLSCQKIQAGRHPDVRVVDLAYQAAVRGEPVEKQQTLKIETVLEERRRLYQTPGEGAWKMSILADADKMSPDAANVLLKVLEEPPPQTAIFLLTPSKDRLLATIVSRCQPVRFRRLSDSETHHNLSHDAIQAIAEADALWKSLPAMTPGQILSKQEPRRGSSVTRAEIELQLNRLLAPALREFHAAGTGPSAKKLTLIQKAQQQLRNNVPPALVYDHLLIKLSTAR
jgi:DNA polymerase-3 subunit delta'